MSPMKGQGKASRPGQRTGHLPGGHPCPSWCPHALQGMPTSPSTQTHMPFGTCTLEQISAHPSAQTHMPSTADPYAPSAQVHMLIKAHPHALQSTSKHDLQRRPVLAHRADPPTRALPGPCVLPSHQLRASGPAGNCAPRGAQGAGHPGPCRQLSWPCGS